MAEPYFQFIIHTVQLDKEDLQCCRQFWLLGHGSSIYWPNSTRKKCPFKANFLHLKEMEVFREPPDHTGNEPASDIHEPASDIHKEDSGQGKNIL